MAINNLSNRSSYLQSRLVLAPGKVNFSRGRPSTDPMILVGLFVSADSAEGVGLGLH